MSDPSLSSSPTPAWASHSTNGASNGTPSPYANHESYQESPERGTFNNGATKEMNGKATAPMPSRIPRVGRKGSHHVASDAIDERAGNTTTGSEHRKRHRVSGSFLQQPFGSVRRKHRSQIPVGKQNGPTSSPTIAQKENLVEHEASNQEPSTSVLPTFEHQPHPTRFDGVYEDRRNTSAHSNSTSSDRKGKARVTPSPTPANLRDTPRSSRSAFNNGQMDESLKTPRNRRSTIATDIDPTQIVRMALSLNEGRRLGLLPGQLPVNGAPLQRRVASVGIAPSGSPATAQYQKPAAVVIPGAVNQGGIAGHTMSSDNSSGHGSVSPSVSRPGVNSPLEYDPQADQIVSAATIMRAEKARKYFELAHEYRRLLDMLPPLTPVSNTPHERPLGREYNPLQYVRNRRTRLHQQLNLDSEQNGWANVEAVHSWVETAEVESQHANYKAGDIAMIPNWHPPRGERGSLSLANRATFAKSGESEAIKTQSEWFVDPADLLADAYWLEQDSHKAMVEDHQGHKIFKNLQRPEVTTQSSTSPTLNTWSPNALQKWNSSSPESQKSPPNLRPERLNNDDGARQALEPLVQSPTKTSYLKRHLLRRNKRSVDRDSSSSEDEDRASMAKIDHLSAGQHPKPNIGPLERHMKMMMEKEGSLHDDATDARKPPSNANEKGRNRRGGVSEEYRDSFDNRQSVRGRADSYGTRSPMSPLSSVTSSPPGTPRISIEDFDTRRPQTDGNSSSPYSPTSPIEVKKRKSRPSKLGFFHLRGRSKQQNGIAENDFAAPVEDGAPGPGAFDFRKSFESDRSSFGKSSRTNSHRSLVEMEKESTRKSMDSHRSTDPDEAPRSPITTRFFKGGRIGEIVRSEIPRKADVVWKRTPPRNGSTDSGSGERQPRSRESRDDTSHVSTNQHRRSQSVNDVQSSSKYNAPALPAFKSINASDGASERRPSTAGADHISVQQQAIREQRARRRSRFNRLAPLATPADSSDVSPNTSSPNLLRSDTVSSRPNDRSIRSNSASPSSAIRVADQRLNKMLNTPGSLGIIGGLPPTGLSAVDAKQRSRSRGHREWSIADDESSALRASRPDAISLKMRDVAYVRSLLLSSGIKAQTIVRTANTPRPKPSPFLTRVYASLDPPSSPPLVSRREEHVFAARLLSSHLERTVSGFESDANKFRGQTCIDLAAQIADTHDMINARLMPNVRSAADDADAFIRKLTTTNTLAIKQVNDNVEGLMRSRWRRLRWLQRKGWYVLEWGLVALMWAIWMIVLVVRLLVGIPSTFVMVVKWLLWL